MLTKNDCDLFINNSTQEVRLKNFLFDYEKKVLSLIKKIGRMADKNGISAYLVGGAVRDIILGCRNLDIDIVVDNNAIEFADNLSSAFNVEFIKYKKFGTATGMFPGKIQIDLASARKETYDFSGALPTVFKGDLNDDLFRRDFTINAMAISINRKNFGRLIDEWGGFKDLKNKKIRVMHKNSFKDDPTRLMRAVRFEQRFDFKIEKQTLSYFKEALRKKYFLNVN